MKTQESNSKTPAYKLNSYRNIFYSGHNRLEEMNELLGSQQNVTYEYKLNSRKRNSDRLLTQVWWKD